MKKQKPAYYIMSALLLVLAGMLLALSLNTAAVLCAAAACVPFIFALREKNAEIDEANKTAENCSKALQAQEQHHAEELQRVTQSSLEELRNFRSTSPTSFECPFPSFRAMRTSSLKIWSPTRRQKKNTFKKSLTAANISASCFQTSSPSTEMLTRLSPFLRKSTS